jgi:hypothetical protein
MATKGRPSKEECNITREAVWADIKNSGFNATEIIKCSGVSEPTFYRWLRTGITKQQASTIRNAITRLSVEKATKGYDYINEAFSFCPFIKGQCAKEKCAVWSYDSCGFKVIADNTGVVKYEY